jgi:CBS domain-containing protein
MNVGQVCSRGVVSVQEGATVTEVAQLMRSRNVGAIVVVETRTGQPVARGIITDRDIVRAQLEHALDLSELAAFGIMTVDPLLLPEDTDIDEAMNRMLLHGVRRAPVIDTHGSLVGLISTDDLVSQMARELASLARLLELQPAVERISASLA